MEIKLTVPDYSPESGITLKWEDNFKIGCKIDNGNIILSSNPEGLISLANHLLNLSQLNVPNGSHIHLDEGNSLEEGSSELIIQRT